MSTSPAVHSLSTDAKSNGVSASKTGSPAPVSASTATANSKGNAEVGTSNSANADDGEEESFLRR